MNLSGVKNHVKIYLTDDTVIDVTNKVADVLVWEKANGRSFVQSDRPEFRQLLWVAWAAAKREKKTEVAKFDDFMHLVDDFEIVDDDEDGEGSSEGPTQPEASAE